MVTRSEENSRQNACPAVRQGSLLKPRPQLVAGIPAQHAKCIKFARGKAGTHEACQHSLRLYRAAKCGLPPACVGLERVTDATLHRLRSSVVNARGRLSAIPQSAVHLSTCATGHAVQLRTFSANYSPDVHQRSSGPACGGATYTTREVDDEFLSRVPLQLPK